MTQLARGANLAVATNVVTIALDWEGPPDVESEGSAYLLGPDGKVGSDEDMIFYNNRVGGAGAIRMVDSHAAVAFEIDFAALPAAIARIAFCVTIGRGTLATLAGARIDVNGAGGESIAEFAPPLSDATESAMTFGELYRRDGAWKFRAVGQGFNGGLAPLARSFGVDVGQDPAPAPAPAPAPPPTPAPAPAPPPAPSRPISLAKVSLDKPGQTVSLEKRGTSFGEIIVNLNWSRGKRGFFGGNAVDLDLGCLLEMADGKKGVVQALGRMFGDYQHPPYIALDGDDRTGDVSQGETMRINGLRWAEIRRVAIFANIYEGVPNWQQTDGVVVVTMPDQPPIEVRMTAGRDNQRLCGVVLLENDRGALKATRIVDYFRDQSELDQAFGWGLRWVAGRKD